MKVVITSATDHECQLIKNRVNELYINDSKRLKVSFHTSGVGMMATCFSLQKLVQEYKPDLLVQAGIAGTFSTKLHLTQVVAVSSEVLGDVGVEENGNFRDVFDLKLQDENDFPFREKKLENPWMEQFNLVKLRQVPGVTVNEITSRDERYQALQQKYGAEIESMEGAALHYVALLTNTPFLQIRSISNFVGERNKQNWRIEEALENLSTIILQLVDRIYQVK